MKGNVSKPCIYKVNGRWYASIKVEGITLLIPGQPTIDSAWKTLQGRVSVHYCVQLPNSKMRREVGFKGYVLDQLVVCGIYNKAHESDAIKAVNDLINWNVQVALDPAVSSDAVKLQNEAYQKAVDLCLRKDYPFDIDMWLCMTKKEVAEKMARAIGEEIEKCIVPLNER